VRVVVRRCVEASEDLSLRKQKNEAWRNRLSDKNRKRMTKRMMSSPIAAPREAPTSLPNAV
jgi:hypothetical protein